jgi:acetyl-CoA synthetase
MSNTGPERSVPPATEGAGGAAEADERSREMNSRSLGPAGAAAGEGRGPTIETMLLEERRYPPSAAFAAQANAQPDIYERDFEEFWATEARERVTWFEPFTELLDWKPPYAKWYLGGKLNVCFNCVDRHVEEGQGSKVAYHWEGEPEEDRRTITFSELQGEVVKLANALKRLGVGKGTAVGIYMGMVPELPVAMLACARLGAPHTVVFGGFSAESLSGRLNDMGCEVLITQDEAWRKGSPVPLKRNADDALAQSPTVKKAIVFRRTGNDVAMDGGRDEWWHELVAQESDDPGSCPCEPMDSEDLLYLLYTSGTTAKPKGIVHTTGGYLVGAATTHYYIFDVKPDSVFWCAADVGWVTGHSYIVYGPLCNGTTGVMYEGVPDFPDRDRWWAIVERYGVDILYTAPTAIRSHMKWGAEHAQKHDLSSIRLLGTVGEPINPEAWVWYREVIGGDRVPVVDTWWQTETGMILITPLPGVTTLKPGSATKPFPGVDAAVYDEQGNEVGPGGGGYLVLRRPWPAMLRGIHNDHDRYVETYWSRFADKYFAGDGARIDEDGDFWLMGRVDDVMNVSGHRISTIEVESALVDHRLVAEAAVAARFDGQTGQAIVAFVSLKGGEEGSLEMLEELRNHVAKKIGPIAKPANIVFTPELPKTRSGKIMRRLLRDVAENRPLGDTTALADPTVVDEIRDRSATEAPEE